jgi:hypothetical protein
MIVESVHRRYKPRGVGFPFDPSQKVATMEVFPIEVTDQEKVKIKSILISFRWAFNGGPVEEIPEAGMTGFKSKQPILKGPTH